MIILSSKSPRRAEIMQSAGYKIKVVSPTWDETQVKSSNPEKLTGENSYGKMQSAINFIKNNPEYKGDETIVAADTIVVFYGKIFSKPKDEDEAYYMLSMLSGGIHEVITSVSIGIWEDGDYRFANSFHCTTEVEFFELEEQEIKEYIEAKEPFDKAGGYGIQGIGARFVKHISGDFYNVMGLPISRLAQVLKKI